MYGYYHPLFARHLMFDHTAEHEALRELFGPTSASPSHGLTRWIAPVATALVGLTIVASLMAVDSSSTGQSAHLRYDPAPTYTCTVGGVKVRSFGPCPSAL